MKSGKTKMSTKRNISTRVFFGTTDVNPLSPSAGEAKCIRSY